MYSAIIAVAAVAGVANAWNGNVSLTATAAVYITTEVVESYTTYCPFATTVVQNNITYTATASEILTITDCPCTLTHTTSGIPPVAIPSQTIIITNAPTSSVTLVLTTSIFIPTAPPEAGTTTAPAGVALPTVASSGFGVAPKPSSTAAFTGAANKLSGGGVAGLLGLAAYIL